MKTTRQKTRHTKPAGATASRLRSSEPLGLAICRALLEPKQPVMVTRHGVSCRGIHYGQAQPDLMKLIGQNVTVRFDEVSRVSVRQPNGRFVCYADANRRLPVVAQQKDLDKAVAELRRERLNSIRETALRLTKHQGRQGSRRKGGGGA